MSRRKGSLGGGVFSIREVEYLESLPAVDRVRSGRIIYNDAFKRDCIRRYRNGESPAEIFRSAGLDSALIGYKRIERSIARWRATLGDDDTPPTVPSPFIVSKNNRWNPSMRRRLNSVASKPDRHYQYIDDTADKTPIASNDPQQPESESEDNDTRNLIIVQQARRIRELEQEINALRRAARDTSENTRGGGLLFCAFTIPQERRGSLKPKQNLKTSDSRHYACRQQTTAVPRPKRGSRGPARRDNFGSEGATCAARIERTPSRPGGNARHTPPRTSPTLRPLRTSLTPRIPKT